MLHDCGQIESKPCETLKNRHIYNIYLLKQLLHIYNSYLLKQLFLVGVRHCQGGLVWSYGVFQVTRSYWFMSEKFSFEMFQCRIKIGCNRTEVLSQSKHRTFSTAFDMTCFPFPVYQSSCVIWRASVFHPWIFIKLKPCLSFHQHVWSMSHCFQDFFSCRKIWRILSQQTFGNPPHFWNSFLWFHIPKWCSEQVSKRIELIILVYEYLHNWVWKRCPSTTWQKGVSIYGLNL